MGKEAQFFSASFFLAFSFDLRYHAYRKKQSVEENDER